MIIGTCQLCGRAFESREAFAAHVAEHDWREQHPTPTEYTRDDLKFLEQLAAFGRGTDRATTTEPAA